MWPVPRIRTGSWDVCREVGWFSVLAAKSTGAIAGIPEATDWATCSTTEEDPGSRRAAAEEEASGERVLECPTPSSTRVEEELDDEVSDSGCGASCTNGSIGLESSSAWGTVDGPDDGDTGSASATELSANPGVCETRIAETVDDDWGLEGEFIDSVFISSIPKN